MDERDPIPYLKDLSHRIALALAELFGTCRNWIAFIPIFLVLFTYWNFKDVIRRWLRLGALSYLSFSVILLVIEVVVELLGKHEFLQVLDSHPRARAFLLAFFALAVAILLAHHQIERRRAGTEYRLAEQLWLMLANRDISTEKEFTQFALPIIHAAFERLSVTDVWLWRRDGSKLVIGEGCRYPSNSDANHITTLEIGEGVAGSVALDQLPRYVPRVYLPFNSHALRSLSWRFPHALKFSIRRDASGLVNIVNFQIAINAVKPVPLGREPFRALVAVPLTPARSGAECLGVLCVDFAKTDPLGLAEVKMAASLGLLMADEFSRVQARQRDAD